MGVNMIGGETGVARIACPGVVGTPGFVTVTCPKEIIARARTAGIGRRDMKEPLPPANTPAAFIVLISRGKEGMPRTLKGRRSKARSSAQGLRIRRKRQR